LPLPDLVALMLKAGAWGSEGRTAAVSIAATAAALSASEANGNSISSQCRYASAVSAACRVGASKT